MTKVHLRFPDMRVNMMDAIEFLAGSDEIIRIEEYEESGTLMLFFDFDLAIHLLFDDISDLSRNTSAAIGDVLYDEDEAMAVAAVIEALNIVLEIDYPDDLDMDYVKTPRWLAVIESARNALKVMK
jgi:hypothetical protein